MTTEITTTNTANLTRTNGANMTTTTITSTTANDFTPSARLLPERTIARMGVQRGVKPTGMHLEAVRDHLKKVVSKQEPVEHERSLSHLNLDFTGGKLVARFLNANGLSEPHYITRSAWGQIAPHVLPQRGGSFLLEQANLGSHGEKLSNMSWASFAANAKDPRMLRVVKQKHGDTIVPVIRACVSQGYAAYDNLTFVEDLLANIDADAYPVLQYTLADDGMRVRFATEPVEAIELKKPIPMIEAWNSETGHRRTSFKAGAFKLVCTNGMGHWDSTAEYAWRHYGRSERIRNGVRSALAEVQTAASGIIELYNKALVTEIDDAFAWMMRELEGAGVSQDVRTKAVAALDHETTTPGRLLASTIDAVTLIAQDFDLFTQAELEGVGARLMTRGLSQARDGRIHFV